MRDDATGRNLAGAGISALLWLQGRILVNQVRSIFTNRRRLLFWVILILWIGFWGVLRVFTGAPAPAPPVAVDLGSAFSALVPGIVTALLGLAVWRGASRPPALFASPADARFLVGSRLSPATVIIWLHLRMAGGWILGVAWAVFFVWLFILLGSGTRSGYARAALTIALVGVGLNNLILPSSVLARGRLRPAVRLVGIGLLLLGAALFLLALVDALSTARAAGGGLGSLWAAAQALDRIGDASPVARWWLGAFHAQAGPLLSLVAAVLATLAIAVASGRDVYPELWSASVRAFELRSAALRGGWAEVFARNRKMRAPAAAGREARRVRARSVTGAGRRVPGGAWVVLWRDWLGLVRSGTGLLGWGGIIAGAVVVGAIIGRLIGSNDDAMGTVVGILATYAALFFSVTTTTRMGHDLKRPVWWLSTAPLRWRIAARNTSHTLQWAIPLWLFLLSVALGSGQLYIAYASLPLVFIGLWLVQGISIAAYAVIPAASDMRGPGQFFRILSLLVCMGVFVLIGVGVGQLLDSLLAGVAAATLAGFVGGWLLVAFAAGQIAERGHLFAADENR